MKAICNLIKWIIKLGFGLLAAIIAVIFIINLFMILTSWSQIHTVDELRQTEYLSNDAPVLVFGAGVVDNAYPSQILQLRLDKAYEVYEENPNKQFIMSGDHREDNYNEVAVMKDYLVEKGIPSDQIYLDHAGYSTYDSLYRLKHAMNIDQAILVTQGYHLPRALLLARDLGIESIGVPAAESTSTRFEREFREIFARLKDFAVVYLGYEETQPTLDYQFDINHTGNETNDKDFLENKE